MEEAEKIGRFRNETRTAGELVEQVGRIIVTKSAPGCAECGRPGASAVRTETGWEGRCGTDGRCGDLGSLVKSTLEQIDRVLAEEPASDALRLVEVPPRHAMTQNVPLAWTWDFGYRPRRHDGVSTPTGTIEMVPDRRPDGFSQAAVDAAKAVLLQPVPKRGGR